MKDQRVALFRTALEQLIESLAATVRVARWPEGEPQPEPLQASASALVVRIGVADRLAQAAFTGNSLDKLKVEAICKAIRTLDSAYVRYRQKSPTGAQEAAEALISALDEVESGASAWR